MRLLEQECWLNLGSSRHPPPQVPRRVKQGLQRLNGHCDYLYEVQASLTTNSKKYIEVCGKKIPPES